MNISLPSFVIVALLAGCGSQPAKESASAAAVSGGCSAAASRCGSSAGSGHAAGTGGPGSAADGGGSPAISASAAGHSAAAGGGDAGVAAGSGASSDDAIPATFETVKLVLGGGGGIMPCAAAPCHGVHGMAPPNRPLELPSNDDKQLYANLTSYVSAGCNNTKLVDPGKPMQSALITILSGPCGATPRMPYGCSEEAGDCIPAEYIAAVAQWIASGAPQH